MIKVGVAWALTAIIIILSIGLGIAISDLNREIRENDARISEYCHWINNVERLNVEYNKTIKELEEEIKELKYLDKAKSAVLDCITDISTSNEFGVIRVEIADLVQCIKDKEEKEKTLNE